MSSNKAIELYGATPDDNQALYERASSHYLELLEEEGRPPRMAEVAGRLWSAHSDDYPSAEFILQRLTTKAFQEELRLRRKEHLIQNIGPRLLMAEMAASIGREALVETLDRLKDPESRKAISNRDLNAILKTAADLANAADKEIEEVAQLAPVNKGTIVQLFTQLSPERAAVVMQELARQATAKERQEQ